MSTDPVCRMPVSETEAPATSQYGGRIYYFCSRACKAAFDKNPEKYASQKP